MATEEMCWGIHIRSSNKWLMQEGNESQAVSIY